MYYIYVYIVEVQQATCLSTDALGSCLQYLLTIALVG